MGKGKEEALYEKRALQMPGRELGPRNVNGQEETTKVPLKFQKEDLDWYPLLQESPQQENGDALA